MKIKIKIIMGMSLSLMGGYKGGNTLKNAITYE